MDRRDFLKTLVGGAGAVVAGRFVINDPVVLAGDLMVPNPEPTIVQATTMPERIDYAADAILTDWQIDMDPVQVEPWGSAYTQYTAGLEAMTCRLTITTNVEQAALALREAQKVRLYVVDQMAHRKA